MRKNILQIGRTLGNKKVAAPLLLATQTHQQESNFSTINNTQLHGGLKDKDRIFTNLYENFDRHIDGAMKRVCIKIGRAHV